MQHDLCAADGERRIEALVADRLQVRLLHQRHYHTAPIPVEHRGLHNDDEGNAVAVRTGVAVNVELRHRYSVEYSSAKEPCRLAKSFHVLTASFTMLASAVRRCCSAAR